jgi:hypothetical protein
LVEVVKPVVTIDLSVVTRKLTICLCKVGFTVGFTEVRNGFGFCVVRNGFDFSVDRNVLFVEVVGFTVKTFKPVVTFCFSVTRKLVGLIVGFTVVTFSLSCCTELVSITLASLESVITEFVSLCTMRCDVDNAGNGV